MRVVQVLQGTPEWHEFRRGGIGGSDAPVVLKISPYRTPRNLLLEKIGSPVADDQAEGKEYIFAQGHKTEAMVRTQFQELTGIEMAPLCAIHATDDHRRASLDGYDPEEFGVLEAKLVGAEVLQLAKTKGEIPAHHFAQLQHNMGVVGHDVGQWFGHDGKKNGIIIPIKRDKKYQAHLFGEEDRFWEMVQKRILPDLTDQDYLYPEDTTLLAQLRDSKELSENSAAEFAMLKLKAAAFYKHPKIAGAGVKLFRVMRGGGINWQKIPEIAMELEKLNAKHEAAVQKVIAKHQKALAGKPEYLAQFEAKPVESWTLQIEKVKAKK